MADMLPKSLKRFGLGGCGEGGFEVLDQVRELIERKEELVPALELIALNYPDSANLRGGPYVYSGYDEDVGKNVEARLRSCGF
jgi:hypothetical protein